jgi:ArsR family transcriptional regulator, lead/cadmium/zinc/bismuth-responsive transcriptional repressor
VDTQISGGLRSGFEPSLALLKALADPTRLRLVWALSGQELPVSQLAELAGAQVAAVSQHLARLREAGVVASRRDGTRIFYRLATPQVARLLDEVVLTATRLDSPRPDTASGDTTADAATVTATARRRVVDTGRPRTADG